MPLEVLEKKMDLGKETIARPPGTAPAKKNSYFMLKH